MRRVEVVAGDVLGGRQRIHRNEDAAVVLRDVVVAATEAAVSAAVIAMVFLDRIVFEFG